MSARDWTWRDSTAAAALLLVLIVCLPIFLCMAPWVDATFYDVFARVLLGGGVLYRDTFDPMALLPALACWLFGITARYGASAGWRLGLLEGVGLLAGGLDEGSAGSLLFPYAASTSQGDPCWERI